MNGEMEVFSFVAASPLTSWSADIKEFWTYLSDQQGYPAASQYLISRHLVLYTSLEPRLTLCLDFQFGTEPFTGGEATLTVAQWTGSVS